MKKSNEHWDLSIHDYNPNGICVIHVELNEAAAPVDWTYVYCNPAFAEMKGLPAEKLVGQRFYTLFPTASRKWLKPYYEAAYKSIPCELDEIAEEIGAYLHVDAVPTGNSGYCMCILRDVKKNIFEKIKQNEALETTLKKLEKERTLNRQVRQFSAAMGVEYSLAIELDLLNNSYEMLECSRYTNQELAQGGTIGELAVSGTCTVPDRQQAGQFARMSAAHFGHDCSSHPGAGAAGGLGYAFMQYFHARRCSGADLLLEALDMRGMMQGADVVITGEGSADRQTLMGKMPSRVLACAASCGVPVWLMAGRLSDVGQLSQAGFARLAQVTPDGCNLAEAMQAEVAMANIQSTVREWFA